MSRRELLQWSGLVATGVILSPTPFAAIDDLTIRTQTHGRSRALPQGPLGRVQRHCPGCPRGCALEVLTVGGAPYLCVPAHRPSGALRTGCALLPAVHQFALHPRRARRAVVRTGFGLRPVPPEQGANLLVDWIEDARREGTFDSIALLDLSGRPPLGRPLDVLLGAMPGARLVERDDGHGWLDRIAAEAGLPDELSLGVDPRGAEVVGPRAALTDAVHVAGAVPPLVIEPDGSGLRPLPELELEAFRRAGAPNFLAYRRPWPAGAHLDGVADGSLSLLLVDASRAVCAIPWRRLRRKLVPGQGRLVVWSSQDGPAFGQSDLALPAPASFEGEEIVGGDRGQPRPGLAVTPALYPAACPDCGPLAIAARLGVEVEPAARRLARTLARAGSGFLESVDREPRRVDGSDVDQIERAFRSGAVWRAEPVEVDVAGRAGGPVPLARRRAPWLSFAGPPVVAAGEPLPPALSKLTREFPTVRREGEAGARPETLDALGIRAGQSARLRTARGTVELVVHEDPTAPDGAVVAALGFGGDCFGDDPERRRQEPLLARLDFDPQLDPPDACAVQEVM